MDEGKNGGRTNWQKSWQACLSDGHETYQS